MKVFKLRLSQPWGDTPIIVERKSIKRIRLKVFPDGTVKLSAPRHLSNAVIDDFLQSKAQWVEKSLNYFERYRADEAETVINSGASTRMLGRQYKLSVSAANFYKIEQRGDCIYIYTPAGEDQAALQKQFERWWQKRSRAYFLEVIDRLHSVVAKYGVDKPSLQVRKMRTRWGSCSRQHHKINLNSYLFKAPPPCIDYVVLHELIHFLYPRHDRDFYDFLTVQMPDWKERKRILDHEVVRGLGYEK